MTDREKGMVAKYVVNRVDGRDHPGQKHENCQYFVLDLTHDQHAWAAITAYAESCKEDYPALAADLIRLYDERAGFGYAAQ